MCVYCLARRTACSQALVCVCVCVCSQSGVWSRGYEQTTGRAIHQGMTQHTHTHTLQFYPTHTQRYVPRQRATYNCVFPIHTGHEWCVCVCVYVHRSAVSCWRPSPPTHQNTSGAVCSSSLAQCWSVAGHRETHQTMSCRCVGAHVHIHPHTHTHTHVSLCPATSLRTHSHTRMHTHVQWQHVQRS